MYKIKEITANNINFAVHVWYKDENKCNLFYFHGLQSHGGWAKELGDYLESNGINMFMADRRGSGLSEGKRGHLPNKDILLSDYQLIIKELDSSLMRGECWFLGQSFGASVLASYLINYQESKSKCQGVIFTAPALGQVRFKNKEEVINSWLHKEPAAYNPINLPTKYYTDSDEYVKKINSDSLNVREITTATRITMLELDDSYVNQRLTLNYPVHLMIPKKDLINNLALSKQVAQDVFGATNVEEHIFNTNEHYLEYSACKFGYFSSLKLILKSIKDE